jgi:hypothetical protein
MTREQFEYPEWMRAAIVVVLGLGGAVLGPLLPIKGLTQYGLSSFVGAVYMGSLIGLIAGFLCGLLLYRLTGKRRPDMDELRIPLSRQLVGEMCVLCRQRIGALDEGQFCPMCGSPVHHACVRPRTDPAGLECRQCGGDPSVKLPPDYHD